uniref:Auxin-responsive protein n=1 Tax=Aegilops tauschii subsp. strangulata TaxID=200361 RepID=A0A453E9K7_AEGTS
VGGDGAELHGVLGGVRARLRGHRAHAHPAPPRRPRPQARRLLLLLLLPRRPLLPPRRGSAGPQVRATLRPPLSVPRKKRARVVGWPPVRSFRKNALENVAAGSTRAACAPAKFVKVAVDGAPYLRKVNLRDYAGYDQLLRALQGKFCSHFTIRKFANDEMKLVDAVNGTEYVPTYEDKDGDWMLVGDVPWKLLD